MKTTKHFLTWLTGLLLVLISISSSAQNPTYTCKVSNATQVSCNVYEFDIYLQRTGTTVFKLAQFQCGITINPLIIPAGGVINVAPVPGSSTITNPGQVPGPEKFSFNATTNCIQITPVAPPGYANASIISNVAPGTKLVRVRVACSQAFVNTTSTNHAWNFLQSGGLYPTKIFAYVGTTNTDVTVQASHSISANGNVTLTNTFSPPVPQTVTSDMTEVCNNPGVGATISLASTQAGYTYYLYGPSGQVTGSGGIIFGTGNTESFGALQSTPGTYTVKSPSCTGIVDMLNSITLTLVSPVVASVSITASPGTTVSPGTLVTFTAHPVNGGLAPVYQWYVQGLPVGTGTDTYSYIPADGDQIYCEMYSSACVTPATGLVTSNTITISVVTSMPLQFTLQAPGGTFYCAGTSGVPLQLSNSELGVTYTLNKGGIPQVPTFAGTGALLPLGNWTAGTYTMSGTNSAGTTPMLPLTGITVAEYPAIPVIASSNSPVCAGATLNLTGGPGGMTTYAWTGPNAFSSSSQNPTIPGVTGAAAGTYNLTVTDANACTASASTIVVINPLPTPVISGSTAACTNSAGNVYSTPNVVGHTYSWAISGGTINGSTTGNSITVTWALPGSGWVQVTETITATTCSATTAQYNVTINPVPAPVINGPTAACANSTGNVYSTPNIAGHTYSWAISGGSIIGSTTGNSITVTWGASGSGWVQVTETITSTTCTATTSQYNVTINPLPVPLISGPAGACAGSTGNVYATQAGMTNYTWVVSAGGTVTGGGGSANATVTVTWNTPGAQTVSVSYTDGNGCTAAAPTVYNVTVDAIPVPIITGPSSVCATTGAVYSTEAGNTNYIWTVSGGAPFTGTGTNSITVDWTGLSSPQTVTVTYTTPAGCNPITPTVKNVTLLPLPVPGLSGVTPVCAGYTGAVYTTEAGKTNYIWAVSAGGTITSGGTSTSNTVTVTWNTAGAQTVSVNYNDVNGCTAAAPTVYNVTVNPLPVPVITGPAFPLVGSIGNVYQTATGKTNYIWTVSAGGTITLGGGLTDNSVTVTWNIIGPESVSVSYTDPTGCTSASPTIYPVNVLSNLIPGPAGPITGVTPVCQNQFGVPYSVAPIPLATGYVWNLPPGATIATGFNTNSITVDFSPTALSGIIDVYGTNINGNGPVSPPFPVTVNPMPVPTISGPASVCVGSAGNVYNALITYNPNPLVPVDTYNWTVSPGGTITAGGTTSSSFVTVTWNSTGPQTVSLSYTSGFGCTSAAPAVYNVTVNPLPVPIINGPLTPCATSGIVYTTEAGMTGYAWTVSGTGLITSGATTNSITVDWTGNSGPQTVTATYTDANFCQPAAPSVYNITVNPLPVPIITGPTPVCAGTFGNIYTTQPLMTGYVWTVTPGGTITAGAGTNSITVTWNTAGAQSVSVSYTDLNGCTSATPTVYPVIVNPLPVPTILGPTPVCAGSSGNVYTTQPGMTGYAWTVSPGGIITAGAGTSAITVTWNTAGPQTVSVSYTDVNGCTAAVPAVYPVTVNPLPVPTITGPVQVCLGSTGNVYYTEAGMTGYAWTVSAGGTITAGAGTSTITVTWNTIGAQTISVNYTNTNGCTGAAPAVYNVTVNALPVPTITGPTPICINSTGNIYTTQSGMTGYIWNVSGGTITAGAGTNAITVTWNASGAQTVSVNYTNLNGCTAAAPAVYNVTVLPQAGPAGPITGPTQVCQGGCGYVYSVTIPNATGYVWTLPVGGTITAGANTNTITVCYAATASPGYVFVYGTTSCGNGAPSQLAVAMNPPASPTITGPASVCVNTTGNVYTTQAGMSNYVWTVSAGGNITAGGTPTSSSVTVTWTTAGAKTVSVNYNSPAGCPAITPTVYNVTVNALPVPTISGPNPACSNVPGLVYSTQTGMTGYVWTISAGGTITGGGGTSAITVTWNATGAQSVSVNYTNASGCTGAAPVTYPVTVNSGATPTITGSNNLCVNSGYYSYTTETGMTGYTWTISAGGVINYGSGTNVVTVTWTVAGAQWIRVNYTNPSGCQAANPTQLDVTVTSPPGPAGSITGTANVCGGANGVAYSTPAITGALSYVWTLPAGATIASGAGTNSITVNFAGNASSGDITVYGNNLCGNGAGSPPFAVIVNPLPADAGTITGPASVCQGATGQVYLVPAILGATGYVWTVPAGAVIMTGANTNAITVDFGATAVSGVISVYGTNSCGNGNPSPDFNLTVNPIPSAPVVTNTGYTVYSSAPAGNQWYYSDTQGGTGAPISGATSQTYDCTQTGTGYYWSVVTLNGCSSDTSNHKYVVVTGIESHPATSINIYPVPNDGKFTVSFSGSSNEKYTISVFSYLGVKIFEETNVEVNGSLQKVIDLRPVPNGVYTVIFENSLKQVVKRIVVNK